MKAPPTELGGEIPEHVPGIASLLGENNIQNLVKVKMNL